MYKKLVLKSVSLFSIIFLFSGCFNIGVSTVETEYHILKYEELSSFSLLDDVVIPKNSFLLPRCCTAKPLQNKKGYFRSNYPPKKHYTKQEFISFWGLPDKKEIKGKLEYWIYNRGLSWNGLTVWLVLPIPILVPTGYRKTTLIFEKDIAKYSIFETSRTPFLGLFIPFGYKAELGFVDRMDHVFRKKFELKYEDSSDYKIEKIK